MSFGIDVSMRDLMAGLSGDATMRDLFAMTDDRVKAMTAQRAIAAAKRAPVCAAIARVFATPDGRVLLDAMMDMTFRGHVDVAGLGLPSDVALQQMIADNARKGFVVELLKLANESAVAEAAGRQEDGRVKPGHDE